MAWASCSAEAISVPLLMGMDESWLISGNSDARRSTRASLPKSTMAARSPAGMASMAWRMKSSPRWRSPGGMLSDTSSTKTLVSPALRRRNWTPESGRIMSKSNSKRAARLK